MSIDRKKWLLVDNTLRVLTPEVSSSKNRRFGKKTTRLRNVKEVLKGNE